MTPDNEVDNPDDPADDIDWNEIIATTEADYRKRWFAFNSADCETEEEVTTTLHAWIHSVFEEETEDAEQVSSVHAQS